MHVCEERMKIPMFALLILSLLALPGCAYQVGSALGTGVRVIHHPVDTASSIYR